VNKQNIKKQVDEDNFSFNNQSRILPTSDEEMKHATRVIKNVQVMNDNQYN
jgi:hypothetical protein